MKIYESLTLGQVLEKAAAESPDKVAIIDGEARITYSQLNDGAEALAAGLAEIGFKKGDRVAIYMKNSLELVTAFYALQKIGAIVVWLNAIYRMSEAQFILKNSEVRGLFIFSQWDGYNYLDEILKIKPELPDLEQIIIAGNSQDQDVTTYGQLIDRGKGKTLPTVSIMRPCGPGGNIQWASRPHRRTFLLVFCR